MNRFGPFVAAVGSTFFAFSLFAFLFSFPPQSAAARESVEVANTAAASKHLRPLEMHIANNGLILLRSARVVAVDGKTITVSTTWGSAEFIWLIRTNATRFESRDFGTRFIGRDNQKSTLGEVRVGTLVTVNGTLDSTTKEPTIDADAFRLLE